MLQELISSVHKKKKKKKKMRSRLNDHVFRMRKWKRRIAFKRV